MPRSPKTPSKRKHTKTPNGSAPGDQTRQRLSTTLQLPEENLPSAVNGETLFRFNPMTIPFSAQPNWGHEVANWGHEVDDLRAEAAKQWRWARSPSQAPCPPGTQTETEEMDAFGLIMGSGSPHPGEQVQSQTQKPTQSDWIVPGSPMQQSGWGVSQPFESGSPVQQMGWGVPEESKPESAQAPWGSTWDSGIFDVNTTSVFDDPEPQPPASSPIYVDPVSSDSDAEVSKFLLEDSYADRKAGTMFDHHDDDSKREVIPSSETEESDGEDNYDRAPAPKVSNINSPHSSGPEHAREASIHSPTPGASGSQTSIPTSRPFPTAPATGRQRQRSPTPESIHQLNARQENEYLLRYLLRTHNAAPPAKLILMGEEELLEACRTRGIKVPAPRAASANAIAFKG
jgi:hypothetical protein